MPFGYGGCESCPAKAVDTVDIHRFVWFCLPNKFLISQFWLCCSIYIASKMPHSLNRTRLSWMQWFKVFDSQWFRVQRETNHLWSAHCTGQFQPENSEETFLNPQAFPRSSCWIVVDCQLRWPPKSNPRWITRWFTPCEEGNVAKTDRKANMSIGV